MDQWHVSRGTVKKGPFTFGQLQKAAKNGSLKPTDAVLPPGSKDWVRADSVAKLFLNAPFRPSPERVKDGQTVRKQTLTKGYLIGAGAICCLVAVIYATIGKWEKSASKDAPAYVDDFLPSILDTQTLAPKVESPTLDLPAVFPTPDIATDKVVSSNPHGEIDPDSPNDVWRSLARLSSFPYTEPDKTIRPETEHSHLMARFLTAIYQPTEKFESAMVQYEILGRTREPYFRKAVETGTAIFRDRFCLAQVNDAYGVSPTASLGTFFKDVIVPGIKVMMAGRVVKQQAVMTSRGVEFQDVETAELTEDAKTYLGEMLKGIRDTEDAPGRNEILRMLFFADSAQLDRQAAFWRTWLLPLARKAAGPAVSEPLTDVSGLWNDHPEQRTKKLDKFVLTNKSNRTLTNITLELTAENPWGEKTVHYVFIAKLDAKGFVNVFPYPHWWLRRVTFTNDYSMAWSVWSDQGTEVNRRTRLTNPNPHSDPDGWRQRFLAEDRETLLKAEVLMPAFRREVTIPDTPERKHRLIADLAKDGRKYAFRLPNADRTERILLLRFKEPKTMPQEIFNAEIVDAATGKAYRTGTENWEAIFAPAGNYPTIAFFYIDRDGMTRTYFTFTLIDNRPELYCWNFDRDGAVFPLRNISLYPVKDN